VARVATKISLRTEFSDGARPSGRFNVRTGEGVGKLFARAGMREVKRHECRAPCLPARTANWADGFESRWDSRMERDLQVAPTCRFTKTLKNL